MPQRPENCTIQILIPWARGYLRGARGLIAPAGKKTWLAVLATIERPEHCTLIGEVVRQDLTVKKTIGIYPLLLDETCWFWQRTLTRRHGMKILATCQRAGIPAYLERSRSGNGGHVWIFSGRLLPLFSPAKWAVLCTSGLWKGAIVWVSTPTTDSSQSGDSPKGRLRQFNSSSAVDDDLCPYPDQRQLPPSVRRVGADQMEWFVNEATRKGQVIRCSPFHDKL